MLGTLKTSANARVRVAFLAFVLLVAGVLAALTFGRASAQGPVGSVTKGLCTAAGGGQGTAPPLSPVSYKITLSSPSAITVDLRETVPGSFNVTSVTCGGLTTAMTN